MWNNLKRAFIGSKGSTMNSTGEEETEERRIEKNWEWVNDTFNKCEFQNNGFNRIIVKMYTFWWISNQFRLQCNTTRNADPEKLGKPVDWPINKICCPILEIFRRVTKLTQIYNLNSFERFKLHNLERIRSISFDSIEKFLLFFSYSRISILIKRNVRMQI